VIETITPDLLSKTVKRGGFKVTIAWIRCFFKCKMDWLYKSCTTITSKLLKKWEVEGTNVAYRVAYLASLDKILLELVVNTN
jgi:hypothetical protein